jgi:cytochrome c oxidase subunit 2
MVRRRPRRAVITMLGISLLVLFCAACGDAQHKHPQTTFNSKGPAAHTINSLINPIFGVAGVVFVLVLGGCLYVSLKFRAKGDEDDDEPPKQIHGNIKAELGWTIIPLVVLIVVGAFTINTIFDLAKKPKANAVRVEVYGQQWWWEYRYDLNNDGKYDDIITANDLVIPAGRQVALRIRSRDVIHSWWAPALNGKKDAVPGRTHPLTIEAYKPGEFIGQCTEYCGLSHANMRIRVVAMSESDYAAWTQHQQQPAANPTDPTAIEGWKVLTGQCTSCHRINGLKDPTKGGSDPSSSTVAFKYPKKVNQVSGEVPNLTHLMSRAAFAGALFDLRKDTPACRSLGENWGETDAGQAKCLNRNALEAWLRNPPGVKPMAPGATMSPKSRGMPNLNLTELQIDQLVAYLQTLK